MWLLPSPWELGCASTGLANSQAPGSLCDSTCFFVPSPCILSFLLAPLVLAAYLLSSFLTPIQLPLASLPPLPVFSSSQTYFSPYHLIFPSASLPPLLSLLDVCLHLQVSSLFFPLSPSQSLLSSPFSFSKCLHPVPLWYQLFSYPLGEKCMMIPRVGMGDSA